MARKPVKKRSARTKKPIDPKFDLSVGSDTDPFWVDQTTIPDGISLQWIVPTTISRDKRSGWKPVLNIAPVGGQILMWAPYEVARAQRDAEIKRAIDQMKAFGFDRAGWPNDAGIVRILSASFMCSSDYDRADPSVKFMDVQVTVPMRLSYRQLDAASALKLTPQEYGQRVARMLRLSPINAPAEYLENVTQRDLVYGLPEFFPKEDEK